VTRATLNRVFELADKGILIGHSHQRTTNRMRAAPVDRGEDYSGLLKNKLERPREIRGNRGLAALISSCVGARARYIHR
jgi:hypothetical protein